MTYSARQLYYLKVMDIPAWELRSAPVHSQQNPVHQIPTNAKEPQFATWLVAQPLQLLCNSATRAFSLGPQKAKLLVLSDSSEVQNISQPFHGAAGKMLDAMLRAIDQSRKSCQIAALDSNPSIDEMSLLSFALENQPKVILFMTNPDIVENRAPVDTVNDASSMTVLTLPELPGTHCITSYHPDYLLSHPADKRQAWEHLKCVARLLGSWADA